MAQVISRKLICPGLSDQILICNEPLSLRLGLASRSAARDSIRFLLFFSLFSRLARLFRAVWGVGSSKLRRSLPSHRSGEMGHARKKSFVSLEHTHKKKKLCEKTVCDLKPEVAT